MKKTLLLFTLLFTAICFAQIPTSNIVASYSFTNRNTTTDDVNLAPLTQNGNALQYTRERFDSAIGGIPNTANAIQLNGDYLTRTNINANQLTYSFWIRTDTNSTDEQTIIDDTNRTTPGFGNNQYGNYVYLQNGKIGIRGRVSYNIPNQAPEQKLISSLSTSEVSDGFWHHIVAVIFNQADVKKINTELWVDGVREDNDFIQNSFANTTINRNISLRDNFNTTGNVVIANNRNEDFATINRFSEGFDDLLIYSRQLTATEITQIGTNNGFCYPLDNNALTITNVNSNSANIGQTLTVGSVGGNRIKVDLAYHKSSENFSNATILRNVGISTTLANLEVNEEYKVYIRKECNAGSGIYNSFSKPKTFETFGNLYVDKDANGTADGLTWANAFTDLQDALAVVRKGQSIFIAEGVYKPTTASNRAIAFNVNQSYVGIYGGFAGYETNINQRIIGQNETILSGDLSGNDGISTSFTSFTSGDNSTNILKLGNDVEFTVIDGLTISGGYNPTTVGAGIILSTNNDFLTINQCVIENNLALGGAGFLRLYNSASSVESSLTQSIKITNTIFRNNVATYATAIYSANLANRNGTIVTTDITNCLFDNNITTDNGTTKGFLGSSLWIRNLKSSVDYITNISNSTFVNNADIATPANTLNDTEIATMSLTLAANLSGGASHVANLTNNIIWKNTGNPNYTLTSVAKGVEGFASINIKNTIAEDNFANITASVGTKVSVSNTDPLFTDENNNNFTLTTASPAIDTGFNTNDATAADATDLLGNFRIFNATVDLGAYEFGSSSATVLRTLTITGTNGTVQTNPNSSNGTFVEGTTVNLVATPNTGFVFDSWSGDVSEIANPLQITMDSDKTIVANFIPVQRTLTLTATNGNIVANPLPNNGTYNNGTVVTLTANPNTNFKFDGWSGDVNTIGTPASITITMDADKNVIAAFSAIQRTLALQAQNGSITVNPAPVNGTYNSGTVVTLTATPNAGFGFVEWTQDASGTSNPITITLDANKSVIANFSSTASVNNQNKLSFSIQPNPVSNILKISLNTNLKSIQIYNINGQALIKKWNTKTIDVTNLSKGIYIVKIISDDDKIGVSKFIKK